MKLYIEADEDEEGKMEFKISLSNPNKLNVLELLDMLTEDFKNRMN